MTSSAPKRIKKESLSGDEAAAVEAADKGEAEAAEAAEEEVGCHFYDLL